MENDYSYVTEPLPSPPRFLPCPRCPALIAPSDELCMSCGEWIPTSYWEQLRVTADI